ncbi:MAG: hypothetical protein EOO65_06095, partial [Methanosarcinales archaeon]
MAPECLVPDVSFNQKFAVILALPFAVMIMFTLVNAARFLCYRYVFKQRNWREHMRMMAGSVSALLLLLFLMYLYVTKTILSLWECQPTTPDDGNLYLQVVFEECGKPGGIQETLMPFAIIGILVIVIGYPAVVLTTLFLHRGTVMSDQLMRAAKLTPPRESDESLWRSIMGRTYYQFKPQFFFWIIFIIIRKFMIAFSSLMFSRNSAFQMA